MTNHTKLGTKFPYLIQISRHQNTLCHESISYPLCVSIWPGWC